jgi:hypothetical protein
VRANCCCEAAAASAQPFPVSLSEVSLFSRSQQSLLRVLARWLILTLLEIINMLTISNRDDFSSIQFGYYTNMYYVYDLIYLITLPNIIIINNSIWIWLFLILFKCVLSTVEERRIICHIFLRTHANVRTNYTNSTKSIHSPHREGNTNHAVTFITW